ncbi:MAG TPA: sialidase family protein, partial [Thermoanaerobaculia bacterium]|nr:sialidase family protein [Thermoanaerobaculia bacterium]
MAYRTFNQDAALKALEQKVMGSLKNKAAVDDLLKKMPLSPLEYLEIDMEVRHYEIFIPRYIQELHVRWIEVNEALARDLYGDERVDQILTRWPVDHGPDVLDQNKAITVDTNRNVASTASPAPLDYDGEIQIAVNHRNTNQMVAAANSWSNAGAACNNEDTQSVFYSSNGGVSWSYTCAPSNNVMALGTCSGTVIGSDPALYWNDNNEVFLNYMLLCSTGTSTKYSMVVARSADGGATWTKQGIIKNAWSTGTLEDKNFYAIDNNTASAFYGRHYTCWDRANNEKFAYSSNNGVTWTEVDLPAAPTGGVDLGCEIAVQKNGTVHVVFDSLTCSTTCTDERTFYTKSTNGGVSWSTPVQVRDLNFTGFSSGSKPPVADSRGISALGAIDVDNSGGACDGTLYVTFGDYSSGGATENDVWVSRSTNGGTTWGTAVKVNDDGLAGRTQFNPFLQVDQSNGNVVVAWHDARGDANNRKVDYYVGRSTNCGVSFEANVKASQNSAEFNNSGISYTDENTTDNANRNPNQYGEYLGLDVKNNKAYLAWVDSRGFYPGSSTNAQKENLGFAVVDFGTTTTCTPPAAPTGVTATATSQTAATVSWTASSGATSYNILRSTTSGGPYSQVGTSATPSFSDSGLTCNTPYFYVVQAVGACASGNSAQATATTSACTTGTNQVLGFSSSPALSIPDNNTTGATSTINVANSMTITSV